MADRIKHANHGTVEMWTRVDGAEASHRLTPGHVFAEPGDEHAARPAGEARILVVERRGSAQAARTSTTAAPTTEPHW